MDVRHNSRLPACVLPLAGATAASAAAPATVSGVIDDTQTISLPGNTRPEARLTNDRGRLADGVALDHMQVLLKRPPGPRPPSMPSSTACTTATRPIITNG